MQKKKKNSKFETEDKSNGNPLLHHFFFPPLQFYYENSEIFPTIFFSCPLSISRKMNGKKRGKKKNSKFEREDKSNGNPLLNHLIFFVPLQFSYENSETFPAVYFLCPVSICRIMNAKKKNSKFESEDKRPLIFLFFFHYIFPTIYFSGGDLIFAVTLSLRRLNHCGDLIFAVTKSSR